MLATEAQPTTQILSTVADQGIKAPSSTDSGEGWQLVWCHERCHKVDLEELRNSYSETVEKASGSLMCLKKATGFGRWLTRMPNIPFVLLADWREAKPCWDVLSQDTPHQLQFTLVYCEQERQFKQASQWAASLRARGSRNAIHVVPIHVKCTELAEYAVRMLQRNKAIVCPAGMRRIASHPGTQSLPQCEGLRRVTSCSSVTGVTSPMGEMLRRVSSFPGCQPEALPPTGVAAAGPPPGVWVAPSPQAWCKVEQIDQSMAWAALEQWPQEAMECEGMAMQMSACKALALWSQSSLQKEMTPPCSPISTTPGGSPASFVESEQGKWATPVARVLSSIFKSESWEDISSALQLAEPDQYED